MISRVGMYKLIVCNKEMGYVLLKEFFKWKKPVVCIILCLVICAFIVRDNTSIEYRYLGSFILGDYSIETNIFKSEFSVAPVINEIEAASAAENIWTDIYSYDVRRKRPLHIYRDNESGCWLVCGSLPEGVMDGAPYAIIKDSGKVLAVWHDK